jgi:hypothetical protein
MSSGYVPPQPPSTSAPYPGGPGPQRPSNKKIIWIIVSIVAVVLVVAVLFVGAILVAVFSAIKSSTPYQHAVEVATHDSRVRAALGPPLKQGWIAGGSINVAGDSGHADLSIPLEGAAHKGTLYVVARKAEGEWTYQTLALRVADTGERIDLLLPEKPALPSKR